MASPNNCNNFLTLCENTRSERHSSLADLSAESIMDGFGRRFLHVVLFKTRGGSQQMAETLHIWFLAVYFCAVLVLVAGMIGGSFFLGQRHMARSTMQPFESGMIPVGDARLRFPIQFYLVAMLFVVFDLESVFIYAWAIAIRPAGWNGYIAILAFISVLLAALGYLWRLGALNWGPRPRLQHMSTLR
jgi:NADH-quinone oxidoreductase subunit A